MSYLSNNSNQIHVICIVLFIVITYCGVDKSTTRTQNNCKASESVDSISTLVAVLILCLRYINVKRAFELLTGKFQWLKIWEYMHIIATSRSNLKKILRVSHCLWRKEPKAKGDDVCHSIIYK